jgi:hypothetical protein
MTHQTDETVARLKCFISDGSHLNLLNPQGNYANCTT